MKIAVTGARGFLGSSLVAAANARGDEVLAIGRDEMPGILSDPSRLDGVDVLVHAAAIRHRYGAAASAYRASNIDLVEALLASAEGRIGRFVHVSSVGVYGFPTELPISERSRFAPRTLYSQTKIDAEKLVRRAKVPFTIVRPTIIYGRGDTNGMLDKLAAMIRTGKYRVVGSGKNVLHHTHIDDVVAAILALGASEKAAGEDFIVAGPETVTLEHLGELVAKRIGKTVPKIRVPLALARTVAGFIDFAAYRGFAYADKEPPINNEKLDVMTVSIAFDNAKLRSAAFTPRIGYEQGIARTL